MISDTERLPRRDEGSALLLVLLLMVIGSLIVLPVLNFTVAVTRHNSVLSEKTKRQEAVKAGLRTALADPSKLFDHCFGDTGLAEPEITNIPITNSCHFIDFSFAENEDDIHLGLAATRVGERIPDGLMAIVQKDALGNPVLGGDGKPIRFVYSPLTGETDEWLDSTASYAVDPKPLPKRIWAPNLPVHGLSQRSPVGYQMPAGYPTCTVYFPGTYTNPLTLTGPSYFASGVYYFQDVVTVAAGADVVVGMGQHEGCTTDQEAAFYAQSAPATHNISGLGGTFVLGDNGQFVVTNKDGSPEIRFNQRYVNENDAGGLPSFGVSIMSVNGKVVSGPDAAGKYVLDTMVVPGVNEVPASMVVVPALDPEAEPDLVQAGSENYAASRLTHEPRPPTAPRTVTGTALKTGTGTTQGAVRVTWEPPEKLGGLPVLEYVVTASSGATCVRTTAPLECIFTGLTRSSPYTFSVTARNDIGTSVPSTSTPQITPVSGSPTVAVPVTPAAPTVQRFADGTVQVSWVEPTNNNSPITRYTVTSNLAVPDPVANECRFISATSCIIRNLPVHTPGIVTIPPLPPVLAVDYRFTVTATNGMGASVASPLSTVDLLTGTIPTAVGASPADPPVEPPVVVLPYEPDPIVKLDLATTNPVVVDIPGYIAVPQGIFGLTNPHGLGDGTGSTVAVSGGILAAAFRVEDGRADPGGSELTVPIGLVNPIVQRTFKIITTTTSGSPKVTSTAVVQINQNGAYAINSWEVQ